ncbi:putative autotransporter adhesin-like protein [Flavobacterium cutihirudinis]|uniref:Putative autotransporter adhesin-like protein n=1 Tax=Flavobacterium cutihirudinis TaxID=1265740 RepID=A0A3D9FJW4_9FLAO|nr:head GIN domain-containing protein [Flavobacterium cutihirudinis]RED19469.1 putative autotransporter adhesin-like protein [Flavobacterium cutihirudinis]
MIKIIIHITKFIIAAVTALLVASCDFNVKTIEGSGNLTTEKRIVQGDFKNVSVSNAIDLVIEQSDSTEITVEADDNLQKEIVTKVENGTLIIECKFNSFQNITMKKVTVKMPVIDKISASSASSVQTKNTIEGENIALEASSAASMQVNIEADNISCESGSASSINVQGKALKVKTSVSSGGSIDATSLLANEVDAEASSGGTVSVHPIVSLKAHASSGGNINYNNTPKTIEKNTSSGGSISQG